MTSGNFWASYKKVIITALIGLVLTGSGTFTVFIHNAYADGRYVQKTDDLRQSINDIDHALFEIDQEISFAETPKEQRKWKARHAYYLREKEKLQEKLKAQTNNVD